MKRRMATEFACVILGLAPVGAAQAEVKEANAAHLAATDHLGRHIATRAEAGAVKPGREVGLFYYLWHGQHGTQGPYDVSKMEAADPDVMDKPDSPLWPDSAHAPMLHWGEPLFGYYLSTDEWVLRRHVEMFIDAGIDVLYFDTTNGYHYRETTDILFPILDEYRRKGFKVPKFCYYMAPARRGCGTSNVLDVWLDYYKDRKFRELYYTWNGKPLIVTHPDRPYRQEILDFFTFRRPTWYCPDTPETWYWAGMPKPNVARDRDGRPEMLAITVSSPHVAMDVPEGSEFTPGDNLGASEFRWGAPLQTRSWHDGARDRRPDAAHYGFFLREQMDWALKPEHDDVPLAFVCQWNEWLVPFLTRASNDLYAMQHWIKLADEYNLESSRDIEPMKGGYRDAYYLLLVDFVRRWKGLPDPVVAKKGDTVVYREMTGDCAPRNHRGYDAVGVYTNFTGRNEFKSLTVTCDGEMLVFAAETVKGAVIESERSMNLFLKIPGAKTDMLGYTHRFKWSAEYKIALAGLGLDGKKPFELEFKWSDNRQEDDPMDFYVNGDAAPRGRMNWMFFYEP